MSRLRAGTGLPNNFGFASLALLAILALAGCGKSGRLTSISPNVLSDQSSPAASTAPASHPTLSLEGADARGHGFYPLEIGSRWAYRSAVKFQIIGDNGPEPPDITHVRIERRLTGTQRIFGRSYVVESARFVTEGSTDPVLSATYFRQDPAGLYEADIPPINPGLVSGRSTEQQQAIDARASDYIARFVTSTESRAAFNKVWAQLSARADLALHIAATAPTSAADNRRGGVLDHEITRLQYPLFPGQQWTIRPSPFFGSLVEAHETLSLPAGRFPGYRIRISSEFFGPNDAVKFWYGRAGLLRSRVHVEGIATDPAGNPLGTLILEEEDELTRIDLAHGRHSEPRHIDPEVASRAK